MMGDDLGDNESFEDVLDDKEELEDEEHEKDEKNGEEAEEQELGCAEEQGVATAPSRAQGDEEASEAQAESAPQETR